MTRRLWLHDDETRQRVVALTRMGFSAADIAIATGMCTRTVSRIRVACGVSRTPTVPFTRDEMQTAMAMLDDGASIAEVARTLGRSKSGVGRAFPGRQWSRAQVNEYLSTLHHFRKVLAS